MQHSYHFSLASLKNKPMLPVKQVYHQEKQMSHTHPITLPPVAFPARSRERRLWPAVVATLVLWRACQRTRQHLSTLTDRELADVGLTRTQQRVECAKPFWQL